MGCFVVALAEDLADEIEDEYATLMEEQRDLVEAADGDNARALMVVGITLPDGQPGVVRIPARYGRRLYAHFSTEEVQELVEVIAQGLADPGCRAPVPQGLMRAARNRLGAVALH